SQSNAAKLLRGCRGEDAAMLAFQRPLIESDMASPLAEIVTAWSGSGYPIRLTIWRLTPPLASHIAVIGRLSGDFNRTKSVSRARSERIGSSAGA
ncbi:MAG: hypothetical protein ACSHW6_13830, partial [Sulfitobacter geojensis]